MSDEKNDQPKVVDSELDDLLDSKFSDFLYLMVKVLHNSKHNLYIFGYKCKLELPAFINSIFWYDEVGGILWGIITIFQKLLF